MSWALIFLDYIDLKARLMAVESKEASAHLIGLLILLGTVLVLAVSSPQVRSISFVCSGARFSSGLGVKCLCGAILTISSLIAFSTANAAAQAGISNDLKNLEKAKEWLTQTKTKTF